MPMVAFPACTNFWPTHATAPAPIYPATLADVGHCHLTLSTCRLESCRWTWELPLALQGRSLTRCSLVSVRLRDHNTKVHTLALPQLRPAGPLSIDGML